MVVVTPSTTEAINFKAPTAAQGGNLNAIRPHPSPSVSPRWREAEPFTGGVGFHADHTGDYATASIFGSGEPDPFAIGFAVPASYSRLSYAANGSPASSSSTSTYLEVYRKQQRRLKEIKSNETQKDCFRFYYWSRRSCPRRTAIRDRSASRLHYSHTWSNDQFNGGTNGDSRLAEHQ